MITINEIAEIAGVSPSTVSRVINNDPTVSKQTRTRVQAIIDKLHYDPKPITRSLTNEHKRVIGLVIPTAFSSLFTDPFFSPLSQGISTVCTANDFTLMLWLIKPEAEKRKINIINSKLVEGIIVASNMIDDPLIDFLLSQKIPLVTVGRNDNPLVNSVDSDNIQGAMLAVQHLVDTNRKKLATITGNIYLFCGRDRLSGFKNGLEKNDLPILEENIAYGDFSEESGYKQAKRLLAQADFDGLFAASDMIAIGAIRAIQEAGLKVPQDIALVGFDDTAGASSYQPALTTVRQQTYKLGSTAAELMIDLLESENTPAPRQIVLPTELIVRETAPG